MKIKYWEVLLVFCLAQPHMVGREALSSSLTLRLMPFLMMRIDLYLKNRDKQIHQVEPIFVVWICLEVPKLIGICLGR